MCYINLQSFVRIEYVLIIMQWINSYSWLNLPNQNEITTYLTTFVSSLYTGASTRPGRWWWIHGNLGGRLLSLFRHTLCNTYTAVLENQIACLSIRWGWWPCHHWAVSCRRCVRMWLIRPIWARKDLCRHETAVIIAEFVYAALDLRSILFSSVWHILVCS